VENNNLTPNHISRDDKREKIRKMNCGKDSYENVFFNRTLDGHGKR
jgi:hypothetical protein